MSGLPLTMILSFSLNVQLIYFGCCLILALCGINRRMGFWGLFFFSLIFSPIMGLIILLVSAKKRSKKKIKPSKI